MSMSDGGILGTELYHRAVPKETRAVTSNDVMSLFHS